MPIRTKKKVKIYKHSKHSKRGGATLKTKIEEDKTIENNNSIDRNNASLEEINRNIENNNSIERNNASLKEINRNIETNNIDRNNASLKEINTNNIERGNDSVIEKNVPIIEEYIEEGNIKELQTETDYNVSDKMYYFAEDENKITMQPYGDEVCVTLNRHEIIYGLNMNVITFESGIKETKTFTPKSKVLGEELFIKKYICKNDRSNITFEYDKNDSSSYVKQQIICVSLDPIKNTLIIRNPKNIIAYTGNIKIDYEFHMTGVRSSKESSIFIKLRLKAKTNSNGFIWLVVDNFKKIESERSNESIKIKNEHFHFAVMPKHGFKLHKLIFSKLTYKSTKEYIEVKGPYVVYRTSNDFSEKQQYYLQNYKTDIV